MWYTEDPLVTQKLLHLQPVGETFYEDVRLKNGSEEQTDSTVELPDKLHSLEGQQLNLLSSESGQTIIYKIERHGLVVPTVANDKLRLTLRVEPYGKVSLTLDGKFKRILASPKITFSEAWRDVLGPLASRWVERRNPPALSIEFERLTNSELSSFQKTLSLSNPKIEGLGSFEETEVEEVPIFPLTEVDASKWGNWLLENLVSNYITEQQFRALQERVKSMFPEFLELRLATLQDLINSLWRSKDRLDRLSPQYWFLQAPLDLQENKEEKSEGSFN
jgi:hypothetical protein